jgi:hypothetical protein
VPEVVRLLVPGLGHQHADPLECRVGAPLTGSGIAAFEAELPLKEPIRTLVPHTRPKALSAGGSASASLHVTLTVIELYEEL